MGFNSATEPATAPARLESAPEPAPGVGNRISCFANLVCGISDTGMLACLQALDGSSELIDMPGFEAQHVTDGLERDGQAVDVSLSRVGAATLGPDGRFSTRFWWYEDGPVPEEAWIGRGIRLGAYEWPRTEFVDPPARLARLAVSTAIAAEVACALDAGGAPHCWGPKRHINPAPHYFPPFTSIAVAGGSACGLDTLGGVWCWPLGPDAYASPSPADLFRGEGVKSLTTVRLGEYAALTALGAVIRWDFVAGRVRVVNRTVPEMWIRRLRGGMNLCAEFGDDRIRCYSWDGVIIPSQQRLETTNVGTDGRPVVDFCMAAGELCRQPRSGDVECRPMRGARPATWVSFFESLEGDRPKAASMPTP